MGRCAGKRSRGSRGETAGLRPSRRYGQHFLRVRSILEKIVEAAEADRGDTIVEIGAGLGDLTAAMASTVKRVVAVELDARLVSRLRERFKENDRVEIIQADALRLPLPEGLQRLPRPRKVVGNLPYNVATQILLRFSEYPGEIDRVVVMLQKEVAERIVARENTPAYGTITLMLAVDWETRIHLRVPPSAFTPRPKVESALVVLRPASEPRVDVGERDVFRGLVRAAFGNRRKMIRNALKGFRGIEGPAVCSVLERAGIAGARRGETLSLEEFAGLSRLVTAALEPGGDAGSGRRAGRGGTV